jgi:hypothetical protein
LYVSAICSDEAVDSIVSKCMITRELADKDVQHVCNSDDVCMSTTMMTLMGSLDKPHKHDVSCHWTGVRVERKEEGNQAYIGISINPNE